MAITVADNFQYKGGKPLDARLKFSTILDMTSTPAADLYDGCFAYVTGTKKYYSYDSSNETDPSLGKWKEYSSGGTAGHTIENASGTDMTARTNLQFKGGASVSDDSQNDRTIVECEQVQLSTMPTAAAGLTGKIVQYIGATGNGFTHGYFYECVLVDGSYVWSQTDVQPSSGGTGDYDELDNRPKVNNVTLTGNKTSDDLGLQTKEQYNTMPTAGEGYANKIVQYTGTTTLEYTNGYFYKCVSSGNGYSWSQTDVQPSSGGSGDVTITGSSYENSSVLLTWTDPDIIYLSDRVFVECSGCVVVRKLNSAPNSISDGTIIATATKNQYSVNALEDSSIESNKDYFYRFFPKTSSDLYRMGSYTEVDTHNSTELYEFTINQAQSNPDSNITYTGSNANFNKAYMDFSNGSFVYGDWRNSFFIKNLVPVMLNYDGTEAYKLNPNDLSKKEDGTSSDISNENFAGNAMIRVPKVYIYAYESGDNIYVKISNDKVNSNYKCWAHMDDQGNEIPYLYLPIYNGSLSGTKIRSLSSKTPNVSLSDITQQTYCANNYTNKPIWTATTLSSWMLITMLAMLITKSTNTQTSLGYGISEGSKVNTGALNSNGMFYGTSGVGSVKIFGLENWYGNVTKRIAGYGFDGSRYVKYKLTYSTEDGTTSTGYNDDTTGYKTGPQLPSASWKPISKMKCMDNMLFPISITGGSATTYYCDSLLTGGRTAGMGGDYNTRRTHNGLFMLNANGAIGGSGGDWGISIECRPRYGEESIIS